MSRRSPTGSADPSGPVRPGVGVPRPLDTGGTISSTSCTTDTTTGPITTSTVPGRWSTRRPSSRRRVRGASGPSRPVYRTTSSTPTPSPSPRPPPSGPGPGGGRRTRVIDCRGGRPTPVSGVVSTQPRQRVHTGTRRTTCIVTRGKTKFVCSCFIFGRSGFPAEGVRTIRRKKVSGGRTSPGSIPDRNRV